MAEKLNIVSILLQCSDLTALGPIVGKHFRHLLQVIAGHTIGDDMDGISGLRHVEAGGFHAACGVRAGDEKLVFL